MDFLKRATTNGDTEKESAPKPLEQVRRELLEMIRRNEALRRQKPK